MIVTGVGSRDAPFMAKAIARAIGKGIAQAKGTLRSGHAEGMDESFEEGYLEHDPDGNGLEIYLPWRTFSKPYPQDHVGYLLPEKWDNWPEALEWVKRVHPAVHLLKKDSDWLLHGRNAYQVLGKDLKTPSDACAFWAPPNGECAVKGGTNTAYQIARANNIPCFNIYTTEERKALALWLKKKWKMSAEPEFKPAREPIAM